MTIRTESPKANAVIQDLELLLKDAGLVAADAAATVDSAAQVLNLGTGKVKGDMIVDVTAIEIASNDEIYNIILQGSTTSNFASKVSLATLTLGATEVLPGGAADSTTGRFRVPFTNEVNGTHYPYVRAYTDVGGDIATGINYSAFLTVRE